MTTHLNVGNVGMAYVPSRHDVITRSGTEFVDGNEMLTRRS